MLRNPPQVRFIVFARFAGLEKFGVRFLETAFASRPRSTGKPQSGAYSVAASAGSRTRESKRCQVLLLTRKIPGPKFYPTHRRFRDRPQGEGVSFLGCSCLVGGEFLVLPELSGPKLRCILTEAQRHGEEDERKKRVKNFSVPLWLCERRSHIQVRPDDRATNLECGDLAPL